jgi:rhamnosyl/mannosyltransferase
MGGIETHLQTICRELAESHRVDAIVANDGPGTVAEMDGKVYLRRVGTRFNFASASFCPGLIPAIRSTPADVLHLHLPNPTATLAVLASGFRGPVVITYHSDVIRQKFLGAAFEPFLRMILKRSSAIVCTSQRYLDSSPSLAAFREKCTVVPYGIPSTGITEAEPHQIARVRQHFGSRLIVAVGRLVYYKGFEYLIDAMQRVDGRLLIVGDGPLREPLQQRVAEKGLQGKIQFLGEIQNEHLAPYYRSADVFAFPSVARSEAFGIVQLEAMACGLPVVNTDLDSGVPFVSRHNETGLTVPPRDPIALANALNTLLENPALCATFAAAARQRVKDEFSSALMARRTAEVYRRVMASTRRSPIAVRPPARLQPDTPAAKSSAA